MTRETQQVHIVKDLGYKAKRNVENGPPQVDSVNLQQAVDIKEHKSESTE